MLDELKNMVITPVINSDKYIYDNRSVPRVTEILSSMLHEDYLMKWSNGLGFKRQRYNTVLENAANIGTLVHDSIEEFLRSNKDPDFSSLQYDIKQKVTSGYSAFKDWWEIINQNNTVNILFSERELICPWFGGTLDILLDINGRVFLMDFKTSNHPSYKYFLQLSAYIFILNNYMNTKVDGCGILLLDKFDYTFEEMILDFQIPEQYNFISECQNTFLALVYAYYNRLNIEQTYSNIFGR